MFPLILDPKRACMANEYFRICAAKRIVIFAVLRLIACWGLLARNCLFKHQLERSLLWAFPELHSFVNMCHKEWAPKLLNHCRSLYSGRLDVFRRHLHEYNKSRCGWPVGLVVMESWKQIRIPECTWAAFVWVGPFPDFLGWDVELITAWRSYNVVFNTILTAYSLLYLSSCYKAFIDTSHRHFCSHNPF